MITKVKKLGNYKELWESLNHIVIPDKEDLQEEFIKEITNGFVGYAPKSKDECIELGNMATIQIKSDLPKFNRENVSVNVGRNYYDARVENSLLGKIQNDLFSIEIMDNKVDITILEVKEKNYPDPTNEMAIAKGIEELDTVEKYQSYFVTKRQTEAVNSKIEEFLNKMIEQTVFEKIDEIDLEHACEVCYEPLNQRFQLDTLSAQEWDGGFNQAGKFEKYGLIYPEIAILFGSRDKDQLLDVIKAKVKRRIRACLILQELVSTEDSSEYDPTMNNRAEEQLRRILKEQIMSEGGAKWQ